ncbi:hypothetical protein RY831_19390 [Noviherbaspirillum sp. CPCC 100848]|uniref:Uncharacterized protein n=1 Tax=Noviherbaspirillum album TaxID=3080276 RepID=A0ABU6JDW2_9BURK|nr:hypothetical protein [Noviherbaspirillum sp. CPCC 100848]
MAPGTAPPPPARNPSAAGPADDQAAAQVQRRLGQGFPQAAPDRGQVDAVEFLAQQQAGAGIGIIEGVEYAAGTAQGGNAGVGLAHQGVEAEGGGKGPGGEALLDGQSQRSGAVGGLALVVVEQALELVEVGNGGRAQESEAGHGGRMLSERNQQQRAMLAFF